MKEMACLTKTALLVKYQEAATSYSTTLNELAHMIGTTRTMDEYDKLTDLSKVLEEKGRASSEARALYDQHMTEHRC